MAGEAINLPISEPSFVGGEAVASSVRPRSGQVLSGPERRRRWSYEEKSLIVAESLAPGVFVTQVASRYGLHPNQLYGWRKGLRCAKPCCLRAALWDLEHHIGALSRRSHRTRGGLRDGIQAFEIVSNEAYGDARRGICHRNCPPNSRTRPRIEDIHLRNH
jgi:hypothetical protein